MENKQQKEEIKDLKKDILVGSSIIPITGGITIYFAYNAINCLLKESFNAGALAAAATVGFGYASLLQIKRVKEDYKALKSLKKETTNSPVKKLSL